jgi:hypothetical protein
MRSWIFRHRLRLRVLYGARPEPVEPLAAGRATRRVRSGLRPGEWERRKSDVWIRPRPPPAA